MSYSLRSGYRFPYSFTKSYLRWWYWWNMLKHWYQRMRYGVSFADMWSFDSYLSRVLMRALPHYKNTNHAFVMYMLGPDNNAHMSAAMNGEHWLGDQEQAALDRWDAMIDEVMAGLSVEDSHDLDYLYSDKGQDQINQAWLLFAANVRGMWD